MPRLKRKTTIDVEEERQLSCSPMKSSRTGMQAPIRPSDKSNDKVAVDSASSSDVESDWEEVENYVESNESDQEPVIPKEGVQFTMEVPNNDKCKRKSKKAFDLDEYFRKQLRRFKQEVQESMHKVHLLCLIAHCIHVNNVINEDMIRAVALSLTPTDGLSNIIRKSKKMQKDMERVHLWCRSSGFLEISTREFNDESFTVDSVLKNFDTTVKSSFQACIILVTFLRIFGFDVRIVFSLHPTPLKLKLPETIKHKKEIESDDKCKPTTSKYFAKTNTVPKKTNRVKLTNDPKKLNESLTKNKSTEKKNPSPTRRSLRKTNIPMNLKEESDDSDEPPKLTKKNNRKIIDSKNVVKEEEDNDIKVEFLQINNPGPLKGMKKNRKTVSSDSDEDIDNKVIDRNDCWLEVYLDDVTQWVCVDPIHEHINKPHLIEKNLTQPIKYVLAFDNKGNLKDVTKRYASGWLCSTRKVRVDAAWWEETLRPFRGPYSKREQNEDSILEKNLEERPLPTSISEYKSHPLYALQRHLLKFEGIYPPDAVSVGFIRGEPVYPRHCIRELHSRETWLKEARLVRIGETPYKVVKARPKWNKTIGELQSDLPLDLFGEWQTEDYISLPAKDGKVPRNDYGNVELFKPCMLPAGTVHLQIPGLNRVARKLGIDCAQAMTGWDFHSGGSHPTFDGWVVCEEFKDILIDVWNEEQVIFNNKEQEKREKRIYGNWRRVIKGLLIRERLQLRYGSKPLTESQDGIHVEKDEKRFSKKKAI